MRLPPARTSLSWLALFTVVAGTSPARAEESTLDHVPTGAAGFVHVRAADVWGSAAFAEMRDLLGKVEVEARALFQKRLGVDVAALREVTFIFPTLRSFDTLVPSGHPEAVSSLVAVRCEKPHNREHVTGAFPGEARLKQYGGKSYWFDEHAWAGVHFLSECTFLYGSEDALIWYFNQPTAENRTAPLADPLRQARTGPHVLFALNAGVLPTGFEGSVPPPVRPLLRGRYVSLAVTLDRQSTLNARVGFADAGEAEGGETAVRALLELARAQLNDLDRVARDRLNSKDDRLFVSVGNLYGLALVRQVNALLERLSVTREGSRLDMTLRFQADHFASVGLVGIAAITSLGTNAQATFEQVAREVGVSMPATEPLRKLHAGLEAYHARHGAWPARAICDRDGKPLLSWRVALLPYIGEAELYRQFRLDEPWDSLHNKKLLARMPAAYSAGRYDSPWLTRIQAFAGDGAILYLAKGVRKADVRDGLGKTILLVESPGSLAVHWTKPQDIPFQPRLPEALFTQGGTGSTFTPVGRTVSLTALTADGSVRDLHNKSEEELRAMITRAGGEGGQPAPADPKPASGAVPPPRDRAEAFSPAVIPRGMKVFTLAVEQDPEAGFILPGSRVDVTCATLAEGGKAVTKTVAPDALVVAVDSHVSPRDRAGTSVMVTLALTPEQAQGVQAGRGRGAIRLVLKKPQ